MADDGPRPDDIAIVLQDIAGGADNWLERGTRMLDLDDARELSHWIGGAPTPEHLYKDLAAIWALERWRRADEVRWRQGGSGSVVGLDCSMPAGLSPAMERLIQAWLDHVLAGLPIDP